MDLYIVRYEDGDVEFCSFYRNKREAMKGRTQFKRQFKKMGSVEKKTIERNKEGFLNLFERYAIKHKEI
ncbi:MAG: hypothetical protein GOVbin212_25 [Prokaryotic dsDNA virus sp.]|nr:MAG: hypothetical protein GOVbin212_25 [Prokaryotic dsDNA virus sp.]|tara:strand:- start:13700 stop:13906 length:207 start_codon:yes stop_codon:yes gene_type:complete